MKTDYVHVTEVSGDTVSQEQAQRMYTRYHFARQYCEGKDVLEVACGSGQGLGYLARKAKSVIGGDYSEPLVRMAKAHYQSRMPLLRLDAHSLPFTDQSFDVVILFEAIYYLKDPGWFVKESLRVLRPSGTIIFCNANKDLLDFNPSPHSYQYFSPADFTDLLRPYGFEIECLGDCEVDYENPKQKVFAFIKKKMVELDLMPKTMAGKKIMKRLVFGKLVPLPHELTDDQVCDLPCTIESSQPDLCHKVIFVVAQKGEK